MSELSSLISRLNQAILLHAPYLQTIRHPRLLITALEELNDLIGHSKVKDAVASQVSHLISVKTRTTENLLLHSELKEDKVMLNTVLYGPPGVGKTLIGSKLAKIWYSLGYLDGSKKGNISNRNDPEKKAENKIEEILAFAQDIGESKKEMELVTNYAYIFLIFFSIFYERAGIWWSIALLVVLFIIYVLIAITFLEEEESKDQLPLGVVLKQITQNTKHNTASETMPKDEDIITIVNRSDFVGKYVGWSDKKTLQLLEDNLGKVLFVDEAYALVTNGYDTFGIEVLHTINQFLGEHPGEIIVIFAGYKHLMENGIFHFQPGLCRRFMWQFECEGYKYDELFQIFIKQLTEKGWDLSDYAATKRLFRKNEKRFPNFGGDTERLTFFAELEYSREYIDYTQNMGIENMLTPKHVRRGIRKLQENNIQTNPSPSNVSDLLQRMLP
uniref:ATPase n=1 Tax=Pithovirus LCPAC304 TaxID=2506594 RepID=A0A481Z8Q6_9VIRU|nr:MAG: ATPase [Pithovirus LCPAC304]